MNLHLIPNPQRETVNGYAENIEAFIFKLSQTLPGQISAARIWEAVTGSIIETDEEPGVCFTACLFFPKLIYFINQVDEVQCSSFDFDCATEAISVTIWYTS